MQLTVILSKRSLRSEGSGRAARKKSRVWLASINRHATGGPEAREQSSTDIARRKKIAHLSVRDHNPNR
jgi:hypothetical protein